MNASMITSFSGLPLSFCSSFCVDRYGRVVHFSPLFTIHESLSTQTEEQKERGRPGNEATSMTMRSVYSYIETNISDVRQLMLRKLKGMTI